MVAMSISCTDFFSDLLCREDAGSLSDGFAERSPECVSSFDLDLPEDTEDSIALLVEGESSYSPELGYAARFRSRSLDAAARENAVTWILKVHAFYNFQPLTGYLAINYMDRFLSSRRLPQECGWALQLLSVACLSIATKMEETHVPSLLDFQIEGPQFLFEPLTVMRMELLVLSALKWRVRSVTPFSFVDFFACKVDPSGYLIPFVISRATVIILATLRGIDFLDYCPSSVAAAAILSAAEGIPDLALADPENASSWCAGLSKERIAACFRLMQGMTKSQIGSDLQRKSPKHLQQFRVMIAPTAGFDSSTSFSSSSPNKRRKLNSCFLLHDDGEKEAQTIKG